MAHWNEIRDEWRVREMRLCKVPNSEEIVNLYEQRGDDAYWNQFIELMRADAVDRRIRSEAVHPDLDQRLKTAERLNDAPPFFFKSSVEESRPEVIRLFHGHTEFNGHLLEFSLRGTPGNAARWRNPHGAIPPSSRLHPRNDQRRWHT